MTVVQTAQLIADFGVLVAIASVSIVGAFMMFKRMIMSFDNLAPAIDRQTQMIEQQTKNEEALRAQTQMLQEEVEQLRETLSDHDSNSLTIIQNTRKTLERLEVVTDRLDKCLGKKERGNTNDGN